ncbi:MAG: LTA synthase family protein [Bacteroidota bacterium]
MKSLFATYFRLPVSIRYVAEIYLAGLLLFASLRLVFLLFNQNESIDFGNSITWECFLVGIRFDTVVLAYVSSLPILLFLIQYLIRPSYRITIFLTATWVSVLMPLTAFIAVADIPYFGFFKNRLTEDALQWMNTPGTVVAMVWSNPMHLFFACIALVLLAVTAYATFKYSKNLLFVRDWNIEFHRHGRTKSLMIFLVSGFLCFAGMRGNWAHPIRSGDAFYCDNPFLNQAGLNPAFTFMKSFSNKVRLMGDEQAIALTRTFLNIPVRNTNLDVSPFERSVISDSTAKPLNVVLVLMEGMGARFMGAYGNTSGLTPNLDSLAGVSMHFVNAYSSGIHTNNGVFSTLYGFPALKRIRPMSSVPVRSFSGLPYELKQRGYKNYFYCSHNREFDNLGNFIPANHFDELYTQEDFPESASIGPYGVPDGYLFERLLAHLDTISRKGNFLATVLTASNHDPYIIPETFQSEQVNKEFRAIQYADHAIGAFIRSAAQSEWFDQTVFVFVADHGRVFGKESFDLQLSFSHIPIIIHAPKHLRAEKKNELIGQIDLYPTLMGVLGGNYSNNTAGVDVLRSPRPAAYFSQDDKIGCINNNWLYIYRFGGKESIHPIGNMQPASDGAQKNLELLRDYALSQTQASEFAISKNLTSPPSKKSK